MGDPTSLFAHREAQAQRGRALSRVAELVSGRAECRTRGSQFTSPLSGFILVKPYWCLMCQVKWNIFITERVGALPRDRPGQNEETKHSLLQCFPCHFMLSDCAKGLCGVLTMKNLLPWILQKRSCGFRVYSLQLIIQMCGQCSLLFSGAVPKLFKTMGILCLRKEKFREVILKALPLAYQWIFAFKKQLPSN